MTQATKKFYTLKCRSCRKEWDETQTTSNCPNCGKPVEMEYDYGFIQDRLNCYSLENAPLATLKYLDFLPILDLKQVISLNEGGTPLMRSRQLAKELDLAHLYIKNEGANPTGVFKDRGSMVEITKARELGAKAICVASTGNMAASVAAYSSVAKLPCYVLVPDWAPMGKLSQSLSYGARIIQVRGTYNDCGRLAAEMAAEHNFYLAGDYVFRREGQKTAAYEIIEQLYWKAPDYLVCPVGCGTNLSAIWKGFQEFKKLGFIDKLPRLVAVQPTGCNPVVSAFNAGKRKFKAVDKPDTVASAVAAGSPLDGNILLRGLHESDGLAVEITDEETLEANKELAKKESVFVEPSSALSLAGVKKLRKANKIKKDDTVVIVATATGLKDSKAILSVLPSPTAIEPDIEEINNFIRNRLYNLKSTEVAEKDKVVFRKLPTRPQLKKLVKKEFDINLTQRVLKSCAQELENFTQKGKSILKSDLQHILEDILNQPQTPRRLQVVDFKVTTSKNQSARAETVVRWNGKEHTIYACGVGPVDSIINSMKSFLKKQKLLECRLTDYDVKIDAGGTDAVVNVTMSLRDDNGNLAITKSTSPDVIVASINAFERGYNMLLHQNKKNGNH